MDNHEDLLVKIEDFLAGQLANESLSGPSEQLRLDLLSLLKSANVPPLLQCKPPALPERSKCELKVHEINQKNDDDFLAEQRAFSREKAGLVSTVQHASNNGVRISDTYDDVDDANDLDTVILSESPKRDLTIQDEEDDDDGLYEVPVSRDTPPHAPVAMPTATDSTLSATDGDSSGTSYESYDDDDEEYDDVLDDQHVTTDNYIALPKVKSQLCTKLTGDLSSTQRHSGHLYQRRAVLGWPRRWAVLCASDLYLFKSKPVNDSKLLLSVNLQGRDAMYVGREGRYAHVIRLTQPGEETQWFGVDSQSEAHIWVQHMTEASGRSDVNNTATPVPSSDTSAMSDISGPNFPDSTDGKSTSQTDLSLVSSSEGSSADGVVQPPSAGRRDSKHDDKRTESRKFLPTFFGTLGKKRAEKMKLTIPSSAESDTANMPDGTTYGYVNIQSGQLSGSRRWQRMWCVVRDGCLECHRERANDGVPPELAVPLAGLRVEGAQDKKHELALKLVHDDGESLLLEAQNKIDHGLWLEALVKRTSVQPVVMEQIYENDPSQSEPVTPIEEDIYDEIELSQPVDAQGDLCENKLKDDEAVESTPPPLPKNPPPPMNRPIQRVPSLRRSNSDITRKSIKKESLNFEAEMSAKFAEIESQFRISSCTDGEGVLDEREVVEEEKEDEDNGRETKSLDGDHGVDARDVIKCHSGRTIDVDKEILSTATNPILNQLRNSRRRPRSKDDDTKTDAELSELKRKSSDLRKKSEEITRRKTNAVTVIAKKRADEELEKVEAEREKVDAQIVQLNLIAQESDVSLTRDSSFSSTRSSTSSRSSAPNSRSNSFKTIPNTKPTAKMVRASKVVARPINSPPAVVKTDTKVKVQRSTATKSVTRPVTSPPPVKLGSKVISPKVKEEDSVAKSSSAMKVGSKVISPKIKEDSTAKSSVKVGSKVISPKAKDEEADAKSSSPSSNETRPTKKEAVGVITKCLSNAPRATNTSSGTASQRVRPTVKTTSDTTRRAIERWNTDEAKTTVSKTTVTTTTRVNSTARTVTTHSETAGNVKKSRVQQRLQQWESLAESSTC